MHGEQFIEENMPLIIYMAKLWKKKYPMSPMEFSDLKQEICLKILEHPEKDFDWYKKNIVNFMNGLVHKKSSRPLIQVLDNPTEDLENGNIPVELHPTVGKDTVLDSLNAKDFIRTLEHTILTENTVSKKDRQYCLLLLRQYYEPSVKALEILNAGRKRNNGGVYTVEDMVSILKAHKIEVSGNHIIQLRKHIKNAVQKMRGKANENKASMVDTKV